MMLAKSVGGNRSVSIWAALAVLGCNSILGIDETTRLTCAACAEGETCVEGSCVASLRGDGGGGAPALGSDAGFGIGTEPCDRPGASYCVGNRRIVCGSNSLIERGAACATQAHCEQAAMAEDCAACLPTCQGSVLSRCEGNMSVAMNCGDGFCDSREGGSCVQPACSGPSRCADQLFLSCSDGFFTMMEPCASAALCDDMLGCLAPVCDVNDPAICQGATLQTCREDGTGYVRQPCVSAALCDAERRVCRAPTCAANERRCEGAELMECNADRTGFVRLQTCESPALCDDGAGVCRAMTCTEGAARCTGAALSVCENGMENVTECATAELCDEQQARCTEPACGVREGRCNGAALSVCNAGRTEFELFDTCDEPDLCVAASARCLDCVPNSVRCSPDNPSVRLTCDADGFVSSVDCSVLLGLGACRNGACVLL